MPDPNGQAGGDKRDDTLHDGSPLSAGMWQCPFCDYVNPDDAEECQRCSGGRPGEQLEYPEAEQAPPAQGPVQESVKPLTTQTPPKEPKAKSGANTVAFFIIILCLIGFGVVGYVAYQRGMLDNLHPKKSSTGTQPQTTGAGPEEATELVISTQLPADHVLAPVMTADVPGVKRYRKYAKALYEAEQVMDQFTVVPEEWGVLNAETIAKLDGLSEQGEKLLMEYEEFEQLCKRSTDEQLLEYQGLVRDEFQFQLLRLLDQVGSAYRRDVGGVHAAYGLSDIIPMRLDQFGLIGTDDFRSAWSRAVEGRHQLKLDIDNEQTLRELQARQDAFLSVHSQFADTLRDFQGYNIRSGILDADARNLLELYDQYMANVEEFVVEFEEFYSAIDIMAKSDRMEQYYTEFMDLAMADHLLCYSEIYDIYSRDKELTHPVYGRLVNERYQFVVDNWRNQEFTYRQIAARYETEWANRWVEQ